MKRILILVLVAVVLLSCIITAYAQNNAASTVDTVFLECSEGNDLQLWLDTTLPKTIGKGGEWFVFALLKYMPNLDYNIYRTTLEKYVSDNSIPSYVTRQKYALLLTAINSEIEFINETVNDSIGKQGIMSYIFGLHLIKNGLQPKSFTEDYIVNQIVSMQHERGGWSVTGHNSDCDVTAMVLQALSRYTDNDKVKTSVDKAIAFLSSVQLENGDYMAYGVANSESVSQVIIALSSLGISPYNDSRFIKNNDLYEALMQYRFINNGFSHIIGGEPSVTATFQALCALVSAFCFENGDIDFYYYSKKQADELSELSKDDEISIDERKEDLSDNVMIGDNSFEEASVNEPEKEEKHNYKTVLIIIVICVFAIFFVILLLKKTNITNIVLLFIVMICISLAIVFIDFQTPEEYYTDNSGTDFIGKAVISVIDVDGKEIIEPITLDFSIGETVYDLLIKATKLKKIAVNSEYSGYVRSINGLSEFDYGGSSGWVYKVNGEQPTVSCVDIALSNGDIVEWIYVKELT